MIKIKRNSKEIEFVNIAQDDILKNDGPYFINATILKMAHDYKNRFEINGNTASYTTINFHNYINKNFGNHETKEVYKFWNKIKQGGYSFLHFYNPKYNKYILIYFDEIKSIQKRK